MSELWVILAVVFAVMLGWSVRGVYDARLIDQFRKELEDSIRDL